MTISDLIEELGGRKVVVERLNGSRDMCAKWVMRGRIPDAAQMRLVRAFPKVPVVKRLQDIAKTGG